MTERAGSGFDPERLLDEFERPIFSFVARMVGTQEAFDLTQEVFVQVLRSAGSHDGTRPLRPWVFGIAAHVVKQHFRRLKLRERERERAVSSDQPGEETSVEQRDTERVVRAHLDRLPADDRALLVLRYYHDLSQSDIGTALSLPRSTVRDRLRAALERLRLELPGSAMAAGVPGVEACMRSAELLEVPSALSATLRTQVLTTAAPPVALAVQGAVLMKKTVLLIVLVSVALTVGWTAGELRSSTPTVTPEELEQAEARIVELDAEKLRLQRELENVHGKLRTQQSRIDALAGAAATSSAEGSSRGEDPGDDGESTASPSVDWDAFRQAFAGQRESLTKLATRAEKELTPTEEVALYKLRVDLELAAAEMRKVTPVPILDEEVLSNYLEALVGGLVDLEDAQVSELGHLAAEALKIVPPLDDLTPLEIFDYRRQVFDRVSEGLDGVLDDDQASHWEQYSALWGALSDGNHRKIEVGVDGTRVSESVARQWQEHYQLSDLQRERIMPHVERLVTEARREIERWNPDRIVHGALDAEARDALEEEYLRLQLVVEAEIASLLDDAQREHALRQHPLILEFEIGRRFDEHAENGRGF